MNNSEPNQECPPTPRAAHTATLIASGAAASKVVGLLREIIVARTYGTGIVADAYFYTYLVTGNFFVLLGGFNGPVDSCALAVLRHKDPALRRSILWGIGRLTTCVLATLSVVIAIIAPLVVQWGVKFYEPHFATGTTQPQFANELLLQLYITLPMIVIGGILGVFYAIARMSNKVFLASIAPSIASAAILLTVIPAQQCGITSGWPLALGTVLGAAAQLILQLPTASRNTITQPLANALPDEAEVIQAVANYRRIVLPAYLSTCVGQLTVYVDGLFAWGLGTGSWTAVAYSSRLMQLPLGILNTAILVPMFPRFADAAARDDLESIQIDLTRCLRFLWFICSPVVAIVLGLSEPIVSALFQGDQFKADSVRIVTLALLFLAPQMFFYLGRELLARVFWAFQNTQIPFRIALFVLVLKAALDAFFILGLRMGVAGISAATTVVSAVSFVISFMLLREQIRPLLSALLKPLLKMITAAVFCWQTAVRVYPIVHGAMGSGKLPVIVGLLTASSAALVIYVLLCLLLRVNEVSLVIEVAAGFVRKKRDSVGNGRKL